MRLPLQECLKTWRTTNIHVSEQTLYLFVNWSNLVFLAAKFLVSNHCVAGSYCNSRHYYYGLRCFMNGWYTKWFMQLFKFFSHLCDKTQYIFVVILTIFASSENRVLNFSNRVIIIVTWLCSYTYNLQFIQTINLFAGRFNSRFRIRQSKKGFCGSCHAGMALSAASW